jgi:hypothetical protein
VLPKEGLWIEVGMEANWLDIITRYVLPPILGGAGGLITIWANWGIEKRRQKLPARRALVADWRKNLIPLLGGPQDMEAGTSKYPFMRNEHYSSLRPNIQPDLIKKLEGGTIIIVVGGDNYPRKVIIEEIARIEKKWNLI